MPDTNPANHTTRESATVPSLRVLIVDDQPAVVQALALLLDLHKIPNISANDPEIAANLAAREPLGAVIQDMNFRRDETSGDAGIELFHTLRKAQPNVPILLMTAWASLETAVELVREGAADYIEKPWDDEKLIATVRNLVRLRELELENQSLRSELDRSQQDLEATHDLRGIVYASEPMHRVVTLAVNVATSDAPVMITGSSGSGKEKIAEIIQANSARRDAPFIRVNVGAIPEELIESELFGAEPGAYTGLQGRRIGHFESAHKGTLFLDEIDSLSLAGQVKLLRVLQSGEFQRLGSSKTQAVDVRIISASNAELKESLAEGRFRDDLFFRLNVVEIQVPTLVDRREDILPLAEHFLRHFGPESGELGLSDEAHAALTTHNWPGNVRELENRIQRATVVAREATIAVPDLGLEDDTARADEKPLALNLSQAEERDRILALLSEESGVISRVAARLDLSRQALYRKMARLGIEMERRPKG